MESFDYNIPRKIRELQCVNVFSVLLTIITYQEKLGNYNYFYKQDVQNLL